LPLWRREEREKESERERVRVRKGERKSEKVRGGRGMRGRELAVVYSRFCKAFSFSNLASLERREEREKERKGESKSEKGRERERKGGEGGEGGEGGRELAVVDSRFCKSFSFPILPLWRREERTGEEE
jgi:hypothetical protein